MSAELTKDSPEVVELREAVEEMNAAETAFIEGLPNLHTGAEVKPLADRVAATRKRFGAAMEVIEGRRT